MVNHQDKTLYRDPKNGKIAGVCAGLSHHFNVEVWLIRILTITVFLLGGYVVVAIAYIALWLMLDKRPNSLIDEDEPQFEHNLKSKSWQAGKAPSELLVDLDKEYSLLENKLKIMEAYVTSDAHKVNKEFSQL